MEVKVGGGDRILVLLGSLVRGWVGRVGVRAGWIDVAVGERRSDIFPKLEEVACRCWCALREARSVGYGGVTVIRRR
jgi:hypothetical protein